MILIYDFLIFEKSCKFQRVERFEDRIATIDAIGCQQKNGQRNGCRRSRLREKVLFRIGFSPVSSAGFKAQAE